jgi:Dehydrogenases with different specificities (related to short-chain alcohol dehydrogenases)
VNMASVSGIRMGTVTPMYNATKHAVVGLTRSLGVSQLQM